MLSKEEMTPKGWLGFIVTSLVTVGALVALWIDVGGWIVFGFALVFSAFWLSEFAARIRPDRIWWWRGAAGVAAAAVFICIASVAGFKPIRGSDVRAPRLVELRTARHGKQVWLVLELRGSAPKYSYTREGGALEIVLPDVTYEEGMYTTNYEQDLPVKVADVRSGESSGTVILVDTPGGAKETFVRLPNPQRLTAIFEPT